MGGRNGGLQIDEDMDFQRREWLAQRIGWWSLLAFVVAAALGVFGGGPLSRADAGAPDGTLRVEYDRFVRVGARQQVAIHLRGSGAAREDLQLRVSRPYFEAIDIERIVPQPRSIAVGEPDVTLSFDAPAREPFTIRLVLQARHAGAHEARIHSSTGAAVTIAQLAYF